MAAGVRAYHTPAGDVSKVDYRAVSGIVTVWGRIEIGADEMRAELARVEALAVYSRWSRRQRDAVQEVAANLGAELVELRELAAAAASFGARRRLRCSRTRQRRASGTASSRCSARAWATRTARRAAHCSTKFERMKPVQAGDFEGTRAGSSVPYGLAPTMTVLSGLAQPGVEAAMQTA